MTSKDNITLEISSADARLARLYPRVEDSTVITVASSRESYSASAIARAVEDCDAHLLNLNITAEGAMPGGYEPGEVIADLRVDLRHAMSVVRSLERYGFRVLAAASGDVNVDVDSPADAVIDETLRERVNLLLRLMD